MKKTIKTSNSNLHANDMRATTSSFYACLPSRVLVEIDANFAIVSAAIMGLLREVHS